MTITVFDKFGAVHDLAWAIARNDQVRRRLTELRDVPVFETAAAAARAGESLTDLGAALTDVLDTHPRAEQAHAVTAAVTLSHVIKDLTGLLHPPHPAGDAAAASEEATT